MHMWNYCGFGRKKKKQVYWVNMLSSFTYMRMVFPLAMSVTALKDLGKADHLDASLTGTHVHLFLYIYCDQINNKFNKIGKF
jgi:hypothetical protein